MLADRDKPGLMVKILLSEKNARLLARNLDGSDLGAEERKALNSAFDQIMMQLPKSHRAASC